MFAVTFLTSNSKTSVLLSHPSVPDLLLETLQKYGGCSLALGKVVAHPALSGKSTRGPGRGSSCFASCSAVGACTSPAEWQRQSRSSRCSAPRQTLEASPLSPHSHCFPTMPLKHEGLAHRCYFKLCVNPLLEAQFALTLGEGTFPLN